METEGAEFPGRLGQRHQSRQVQGLVWQYGKWGRAGEMTELPKRGLWKASSWPCMSQELSQQPLLKE